MNLHQQGQKQKQQKNSKLSSAISLLQRKHYGFLTKIFCCKCFYCCQDFDFTLLTSKNRKGAFSQMVKKYLKSMHNSNQQKTKVIMDPFFILVALLLGQESEIYNELLEQVSSSNQKTIFSKEDLQFYIPQLCTYLVFHEQMSNIELSTLLERACKIDLHFSLRYYFFMKSLQIIDLPEKVTKFPLVEKYNSAFRNRINLVHKIKGFNKQKLRRQQSIDKRIDTLNEQNRQSYIDATIKSLRNTKLSDEQQLNQKDHRAIRYRKDSFESSSSSSCDMQEIMQENQKSIIICKQYNQMPKNLKICYPKIQNLKLNELYEGFISKNKQNYPKGLFESTADFFFDLVALSELLLKIQGDQTEIFEKYLNEINQRLPAAVYIPFTKSQYNGLNVVNIVIKESKIFKTKQRAPFKICFQTFYNPNLNQQSGKQKKIRSTINSTNKLKRSSLFEQDIFLQVEGQTVLPKQKNSSDILQQKMSKSAVFQKNQMNLSQSNSGITESNKGTIDLKSVKKNFWGKLFQLKKYINQTDSSSKQCKQQQKLKRTLNTFMQYQKPSLQHQPSPQDQKTSQQSKIKPFPLCDNTSTFTDSQQTHQLPIMTQPNPTTVSCEQSQQDEGRLFGHSLQDRNSVIHQKSPYSRLQGYDLVNLMVKSNDDLRQECFAMQLLQEFTRIFNMEKLKIKLTPYEVMPLSHNSGIIQFVSDAITIDQLIKKQGNLLFVRKTKLKLKNFINSLAGYSLVTYMLQVKDRHNQNIMIKRDGTILHIDYGFFLSSMPGKGVQLQKNLPFKLTNEYVDALGGIKSKQFAQFRKLFYQGFNALRKHQHRIIILTKLMYSSYGTTMRCFQKGDEAIQKFVSRFNPKNVHTDGQLSLFCQELINSSLQNWRAKWYDRWQYFAQGILY